MSLLESKNHNIKNLSASQGERKLLELLKRYYFYDDQIDRQASLAQVVDINYLNLPTEKKVKALQLSLDVVLSEKGKPFGAIEFDGPHHATPYQQELDALKDEICRQANLTLIRINSIDTLEFMNWLEHGTDEIGDPNYPYTIKDLDELVLAWKELKAKNISPPIEPL